MVRRAVVFSSVAALLVFAAVQDRLTAHAVARYLSVQRDALAGRGPAVTIDEVMKPAVSSAVREAAVAGGLVFAAGFGGFLVARRRRPRE